MKTIPHGPDISSRSNLLIVNQRESSSNDNCNLRVLRSSRSNITWGPTIKRNKSFETRAIFSPLVFAFESWDFFVEETRIASTWRWKVRRAILKPGKILLIDEATTRANLKTAEVIQPILRATFIDWIRRWMMDTLQSMEYSKNYRLSH